MAGVMVDAGQTHPLCLRTGFDDLKTVVGQQLSYMLEVEEVERVGHHFEAPFEMASPVVVLMKVESQEASRSQPSGEAREGLTRVVKVGVASPDR